MLPLLTLLAMSAFVPVWEIAQVGRQLADTLGAARRVYAVHAEPVPVTDGPGVRRASGVADIALEMEVAPSSVKTHVGHLLAKLGFTDRVQLVVFAYDIGLVRPSPR